MPGSKYERELRFIQTETRRLGNQLSKLREMMPVDPIEAARKADEVLGIEAEIGVGYVGTTYEQYECIRCGALLYEGCSNKFTITKLAVSLIFMIF